MALFYDKKEPVMRGSASQWRHSVMNNSSSSRKTAFQEVTILMALEGLMLGQAPFWDHFTFQSQGHEGKDVLYNWKRGRLGSTEHEHCLPQTVANGRHGAVSEASCTKHSST